MQNDSLIIGGETLGSRLFLGTAGYANRRLLLESIAASGTEVVTMAIRRISLEAYGGSLLDGLKRFRHRLLHDSADLAQIGLHEFILLIPREHRGGIGPTTRRQLDFAQRRAEAGQRHLTSGFGSYAGEPL